MYRFIVPVKKYWRGYRTLNRLLDQSHHRDCQVYARRLNINFAPDIHSLSAIIPNLSVFVFPHINGV